MFPYMFQLVVTNSIAPVLSGSLQISSCELFTSQCALHARISTVIWCFLPSLAFTLSLSLSGDVAKSYKGPCESAWCDQVSLKGEAHFAPQKRFIWREKRSVSPTKKNL